MYDYVIVGSGLFGSVFAREMRQAGKRCLVIEKRKKPGGNVRCETIEDINCHQYGPHIFHTNDYSIWQYVNQFVKFNNFIYSPIANYRGRLFNLPFNMNTFYQLWRVTSPAEAIAIIKQQSAEIDEPENLEQQAIKLVGTDIYKILVKGYTEKQWARPCDELPAFIIKRLPVRFTFDNNYFNDTYQGIPIGGYNKLIDGLLEGIEVRTDVDYFSDRLYFHSIGAKIVYTGPIDQFFDYKFGALQYRSLRFETSIYQCDNYQGSAVVNFTGSEVPYTRSIEHKHFERSSGSLTVVTKEYPEEWMPGKERYYPINDLLNDSIYRKYRQLADRSSVIFGGRLAEYKYYDMHQVIASALKSARVELKEKSLP